jgi:hypothetical protein
MKLLESGFDEDSAGSSVVDPVVECEDGMPVDVEPDVDVEPTPPVLVESLASGSGNVGPQPSAIHSRPRRVLTLHKVTYRSILIYRTRELSLSLRLLACMRTLLCALLVVGCTSAEPRGDAPPAPVATPPVVARAESGELMLRRTLCYGECPSYTAIIDHDGGVFYHGRDYAERQGLHTGSVDRAKVQQLLGVALDNGYFDTEHAYDKQITDHATYYTSVVVDGRRQWVRNYARAAPDSVIAIELGIDALLAATKWDATPQLEAVVDNEPCLELGRAIESRCEDVLTLRGRDGDCSYWFAVWEELGWRMRDEPHRPERCARQLRSLATAAAPPITALPKVALGPKCREWFAAFPEACRLDLLRGNVGSCIGLERALHIVAADLDDPRMDPGMRKRTAEFHCGMMLPDE